MRAGRLISLMMLLQEGGRMTAARLARELEVSERTVLRDIDELSGAGVPVYATKGPGGGFQLLEGYRSELLAAPTYSPIDRHLGPRPRARIRITPEGRRMAAVLDRLQPLRVRRGQVPDDLGRIEATCRIDSFEAIVVDVLSLGPHVEVLAPADLRAELADRVHRAAQLYDDPGHLPAEPLMTARAPL
jgi:predicted DNA-binding transcriptional regulator YafY